MPIPFRLDYVIEKLLCAPGAAEQQALQQLVGVKLSTTEARAQWRRVLEHQWLLSERLGRDVGLRVAVIDYFENIYTLRTRQGNECRKGLIGRRMRPSIIHKIV